MNYESQRKVLLMLRETTERREDLLKENYLAEKQAFEKGNCRHRHLASVVRKISVHT